MPWIVIPTDGSEHAAATVRLVASIPWPAETTAGVVAVVPPLTELVGLPWIAVTPTNDEEIERTELRRAEAATWAAVDGLRPMGMRANCRVRRGEPAEAIVDLARDLDAELIVMGSRGLGTLRSALIGSVSAEVIDHAPCPVLIARSDRIGRAVIADDGSPEAEFARAFVMARPHLLGEAATLVGVVPHQTIWPDAMIPLDADTAELLIESQSVRRRGLGRVLAADAEAIAATGVEATWEVREGHAGAEIVAAAEEHHADLIVVGTHGRHGISRLALGSVSRDVVHGAHCSVLVVPSHHVTHRAAADHETRDLTPA
jgi:nucleotide-binding universal stress UspA family protein